MKPGCRPRCHRHQEGSRPQVRPAQTPLVPADPEGEGHLLHAAIRLQFVEATRHHLRHGPAGRGRRLRRGHDPGAGRGLPQGAAGLGQWPDVSLRQARASHHPSFGAYGHIGRQRNPDLSRRGAVCGPAGPGRCRRLYCPSGEHARLDYGDSRRRRPLPGARQRRPRRVEDRPGAGQRRSNLGFHGAYPAHAGTRRRLFPAGAAGGAASGPFHLARHLPAAARGAGNATGADRRGFCLRRGVQHRRGGHGRSSGYLSRRT